jgi:cytoskeletal protein RodZ
MNDHIREDELAAYIEGTITPKMRPAIERHLTGCDRCLGDLADLLEIMRSPVPVPDDLLKAALSRFPAGKKEAERRRFSLPNRWAFQAAALFAVALLLGYLLIVEHPPVASTRKAFEISDRETVKADKPLPPATDQKEIPSSLPAPAKIEKKSPSRRTRPPAEREKANASVREKDELQLSREEESGKQREAFSVSRQVPLDAQKGQLSKGPAPRSWIQSQQDQAVVGAGIQEVARPPVTITGDATMGDLQNREILAGFLHFPEPLAARIAIDPQGKVVEVIVETRVAPEQALPLQELIGKLKFTASDKKVRYARLTSGLGLPSK